MPSLPLRAVQMPRSGIRAVMDLAWSTEAEVIRLEVGQPDATPPAHVLEAMCDATASGRTGYTPNAGLGELREACASKLARINSISVTADQVLVTAGSMQGLSVAALALTEPGDEILIPDPGWPNYRMLAELTSRRAVAYPLDPQVGYVPDIGRMDSLVSEKTRALILNSPSNPLGTVLDLRIVQSLLEFAERHDLWVISDECYDQIVFDATIGASISPSTAHGDTLPMVAVSPSSLHDSTNRIVSVHSFSKTYAMTGLRVGYVSGPPDALTTMIKMQEALIACVNGPAQYGALAALEGPQDFVKARKDVYQRRRDRAVQTAIELGLPHESPQGAFYLWLPLDVASGTDLSLELVQSRGVAVAPGETFGEMGRGAIRVSLAASESDIVSGLRRIASHLSQTRH